MACIFGQLEMEDAVRGRLPLDRVGVLFASLMVASGCMKQYPARTIPQRLEPQVVDIGGPPEGHGSITLDVVDGAAEAGVVAAESAGVAVGTYTTASSWGQSIIPICTTPCEAHLPYGHYRIKTLVLSDPTIGDDDGTLVVTDDPSFWRRAPAIIKERRGLHWAGVTMLITGAVLGPTLIGLGVSDGSVGMTATGAVFTAIGIAGIPMMVKGRTEITPGSQLQWSER